MSKIMADMFWFLLLQKRVIAFTNYKDYIGMDLTSLVTLPVWIMEPYTILQKVAEIMEYTKQLDRAAATEDPYERCWRSQPPGHAWPVGCTVQFDGPVDFQAIWVLVPLMQ